MHFLPLAEFQQYDALLTPRQREVLLLFLLGEDDRDIAGQLYVAKDTVRRHLSDICKLFNPTDENHFQRNQLMAHYARYRPELFRDSLLYADATLDLVLSYHQDSELERAIAHGVMENLGQRCPNCLWVDKNLRMTSGGRKQIQVALRHTQVLIVLLSPTSDEETITEEVKLAIAPRPNDPPCQLIVVALDRPVTSLNHDLRVYLKTASSLTGSSTQEIDALISAIVTLIEQPPDPTEDSEPISPLISPPSEDELMPRPSAEPELPTGTVKLTSKFYVERPGVDDRCYEEIQKPSALIRIKAPRQMGKTSLLARILHQAQTWGCTSTVLSLQLAGVDCFRSLDTFLFWLCANITHSLKLPIAPLKDYWEDNAILGSKTACTDYLEQYVLSTIPERWVLGLDEVDVVFEHSTIASDFFGLLRAWHEQGKSDALWQKLALVVVHSTEAYVSLPTTQSPFNVGLPIELPEFAPEQVQTLAQRHGLAWQDAQVQDLMGVVGGHPYLVRLALYHITRGDHSLQELLANAPTDSGLYSDHLRRMLWNLEQYPELGQAALAVMQHEEPIDLEPMVKFKLRGMGVIRPQGNQVVPRCSLYRQYLRSHLTKF